MAQGKKIYTKEYVRAQATEMAKAAGLNGIHIAGIPEDLNEKKYKDLIDSLKQVIDLSVHQLKKTQDPKTEK